MTPTGSWPTMRPFATGYSPRQMCESVPQIVVVVIFTTASVGPGAGLPTSSMWMSWTSWKTAARIVSGINVLPLGWPCAAHSRRPGGRSTGKRQNRQTAVTDVTW